MLRKIASTQSVVDQTKADNPDEEAEFELEEVPEGDRPLVRPGSTFYWTIGMERTPAGSQKRVSHDSIQTRSKVDRKPDSKGGRV